MRHIIYIVAALLGITFVSCGKSPATVNPDELASRAAKVYYEYLLHGNCAAYIDGFYRPDSIPDSYREQLEANSKMYLAGLRADHGGISEIRIVNCRNDSKGETAEAYLLVCFADSVKEEIVVAMAKHDGRWMMR